MSHMGGWGLIRYSYLRPMCHKYSDGFGATVLKLLRENRVPPTCLAGVAGSGPWGPKRLRTHEPTRATFPSFEWPGVSVSQESMIDIFIQGKPHFFVSICDWGLVGCGPKDWLVKFKLLVSFLLQPKTTTSLNSSGSRYQPGFMWSGVFGALGIIAQKLLKKNKLEKKLEQHLQGVAVAVIISFRSNLIITHHMTIACLQTYVALTGLQIGIMYCLIIHSRAA